MISPLRPPEASPNRARFLITGALIACHGPLVAAPRTVEPTASASAGKEGAGTVQGITRKEVQRRELVRLKALKELESGEQLYRLEQYEGALQSYGSALNALPPTPLLAKERKVALRGFADASLKLAEVRISEGRRLSGPGQLTASAEDIVDNLLLIEPMNPAALRLKGQLNTPGFYNTALNGNFREDVEKVKSYLREGRDFMECGRFDLALKRADQVLEIDPYNSAARKLQEAVNQAIKTAADSGYNEARSRALRDVQKEWSNPAKRYNTPHSTQVERRIVETTEMEKLRLKLQRLILPEVQFTEAPIAQVADSLTKASRLADEDDVKPGVLIIANFPNNSAPVTSIASKTNILDLPPPALPEKGPGGLLVTTPKIPGFSLKQILDIVTESTDTKWVVKENRVELVPKSTPAASLVLRSWSVSPFMFSSTGARVDDLTSTGLGAGVLGTGGASVPKQAGKRRIDPKEFLTGLGVRFDVQGSTSTYNPRNKTLTVYNTIEMLDLVDSIVADSEGQSPVQVDIRAKFVEFSQSNLKELSFDWLLGPSNVPGNKKISSVGGGGVDTAGFPFANPDGTPVGQARVTGGNRFGSAAISLNAIDSLLTVPNVSNPAAFALAGALTDPQFQLVVRALNQRKDVDLLSSPSITASEDEEASIDIVREFRYPTEFSPPQIPQSVGTTTTTGAGGGQLPGIPVTPSTPGAFEKRETGVKLRVTPSIKGDNYAIHLDLHPEVTEFEGFINYGSPIKTTASGSTLTGTTPISVVLTDNTINQPIFSVRRIQTVVTLLDGETIALGGLIREDVQKVNDKTPVLGDIPLVGRLFRSNVDQRIKKNLTIFVTARIIDASGQPIKATRAETETEEVPSLTSEKTLGMAR